MVPPTAAVLQPPDPGGPAEAPGPFVLVRVLPTLGAIRPLTEEEGAFLADCFAAAPHPDAAQYLLAAAAPAVPWELPASALAALGAASDAGLPGADEPGPSLKPAAKRPSAAALATLAAAEPAPPQPRSPCGALHLPSGGAAPALTPLAWGAAAAAAPAIFASRGSAPGTGPLIPAARPQPPEDKPAEEDVGDEASHGDEASQDSSIFAGLDDVGLDEALSDPLASHDRSAGDTDGTGAGTGAGGASCFTSGDGLSFGDASHSELGDMGTSLEGDSGLLESCGLGLLAADPGEGAAFGGGGCGACAPGAGMTSAKGGTVTATAAYTAAPLTCDDIFSCGADRHGGADYGASHADRSRSTQLRLPAERPAELQAPLAAEAHGSDRKLVAPADRGVKVEAKDSLPGQPQAMADPTPIDAPIGAIGAAMGAAAAAPGRGLAAAFEPPMALDAAAALDGHNCHAEAKEEEEEPEPGFSLLGSAEAAAMMAEDEATLDDDADSLLTVSDPELESAPGLGLMPMMRQQVPGMMPEMMMVHMTQQGPTPAEFAGLMAPPGPYAPPPSAAPRTSLPALAPEMHATPTPGRALAVGPAEPPAADALHATTAAMGGGSKFEGGPTMGRAKRASGRLAQRGGSSRAGAGSGPRSGARPRASGTRKSAKPKPPAALDVAPAGGAADAGAPPAVATPARNRKRPRPSGSISKSKSKSSKSRKRARSGSATTNRDGDSPIAAAAATAAATAAAAAAPDVAGAEPAAHAASIGPAGAASAGAGQLLGNSLAAQQHAARLAASPYAQVASELQEMFTKTMSKTDVAQTRIILPKHGAEACLPPLRSQRMTSLVLYDLLAQEKMEVTFKFWPNPNGMRMYVLERTADFTRRHALAEGDVLRFLCAPDGDILLDVDRREALQLPVPHAHAALDRSRDREAEAAAGAGPAGAAEDAPTAMDVGTGAGEAAAADREAGHVAEAGAEAAGVTIISTAPSLARAQAADQYRLDGLQLGPPPGAAAAAQSFGGPGAALDLGGSFGGLGVGGAEQSPKMAEGAGVA